MKYVKSQRYAVIDAIDLMPGDYVEMYGSRYAGGMLLTWLPVLIISVELTTCNAHVCYMSTSGELWVDDFEFELEWFRLISR